MNSLAAIEPSGTIGSIVLLVLPFFQSGHQAKMSPLLSIRKGVTRKFSGTVFFDPSKAKRV